MLKAGPTILSKKSFKLTVAGGLVFWVTTLATSLLPIAAEYRVCLFKLEHSNSLGYLFFYGNDYRILCQADLLLRYFDKIPSKNPILKSGI